MSVSVLLADAHHVFREGLRDLLQANNQFRVVADVSSGDDAVRLISDLEVDIAIVDLFPSRMSAEDVIRHISRENQKTSIIVLAAARSQRRWHSVIRAGAAGCLTKTASCTELLMAIDTVRAGGRYLCHDLTRSFVAEFGASKGPYACSADTLTDRECELLKLISEGYSSRKIATRLHLQMNTVESHRHKLMKKLGIHKNAALVRFAIREGIGTA